MTRDTWRTTRQGTVVQCEHEYWTPNRTPPKSLGLCQVKHVTVCTDKKIVQEQLRLAGWERLRSPGGIQFFCPDHTRAAIDARERAKRERATERIWK